jgi:hypothetical protein
VFFDDGSVDDFYNKNVSHRVRAVRAARDDPLMM